jgi:hypothetical protein
MQRKVTGTADWLPWMERWEEGMMEWWNDWMGGSDGWEFLRQRIKAPAMKIVPRPLIHAKLLDALEIRLA